MAYRLKPARSARKGLRRAAGRQLDTAAEELGSATGGERTAAIHTARKSIKKTRALLRLARSGMPRDAYREQSRALRDTGRLLSATRDADVLAQTIDALAHHYVGQIPARGFTALRRDVAKLAAVPDTDARIDRARADLAELAANVPAWPVDDVGWSTVRKGATRAYARGRRGFAQACSTSDPELMHEWRKRVKDLWYHQRLLRDTWKPVMRAHADETDRLGKMLGDDHDLTVLAAFLDAHRAELARHGDLDEVIELAAERRAALRADAIALGRWVYAEKPSAYGRRIGRYVKAARTGERATAAAA